MNVHKGEGIIKIGVHFLESPASDLSNLLSKATAGSAGWDVKAKLDHALYLKPGQRALVPTGFKLIIPEGYEGQLRPRSGWAYQTGVTLLNAPGTIDSDYRGEIKVLLINLGEKGVWIRNGDRIAQIVFSQVQAVKWDIVEETDQTPRGSGGFGHSGR